MMKLFKKSKSKILITALVLMLAVAVSGTLAYIIDKTDDVKNTFTPATMTTDITETFDGETKTDVKVLVSGEIDAFVRAKIVVTWQDAKGNVCSKAPVAGTDYDISINTGDWTLNNGFYYYNKIVTPVGSTANLINSCSMREGVAPPEGYTLHVEILSQAVQAVPTTAAQELWGYVPVVTTATETN